MKYRFALRNFALSFLSRIVTTRKSGTSLCEYTVAEPVTVAQRSRHALSSLARKPGSWVRIPVGAWMFSVWVCVCVYVRLSVLVYR
jgi:hypothetical protein